MSHSKAEIATETQGLKEAQYLLYVAYGTLALISFDILLTFKDETAYVWRRPWSLFKTLYLICRYTTVVIPCLVAAPPLHTPSYCNGFQWFLFIGTAMLSFFPLDCLLAIRLDRLYLSNVFRKVLISSIAFETITLIVLVILNASSRKTSLNFLVIGGSEIFICTPGKSGSSSLFLLISLWIVPLIIAALYLCFAVAAFYGHLRQREVLTKHRLLRGSGALAPIFTVLFRDGVICYVVNIAATAAGTGLVLLSGYSQSLVLVGPVVISATSSIIGSRLVLNLQGDPGLGIFKTGNEVQIINHDNSEFLPLEVL